ncbi:glycosyl hydrolase [Phyllobacterium salinisoli]|uniref:Glycosyl hydrolase n=1 Tax=Phyllobacterium salinisoli TaxID=1899321 RepID=A0A368K3L9_9HYPH|nr:GH25 family lysozyme [Phyllobacterium salinisoli]RCS22982.1 glycosyl hydrolase [Phyllobacterium salinisoli]
MRFSGVSAILFACTVLVGCTSTSGVDELLAKPSLETTSSITPPVDVMPPAEIGSNASHEEQLQQVMALAPPAPIPNALSPGVTKPAMRAPKVEQVALVVPAEPSAKTFSRGKVYSHRFRDAKPINFGRASPKTLAVHGVDVSRWQGEIDWEKLRTQGANFAYIKATDGGDHLDPMFRKNWRRAHEAGLRRGAYHFFYWCRTAGEQADWFIRNVPKVKGALPPVIDVEWNGESRCSQRVSRKKVLEKMQVFMDKLERHYGQRPIIYTAPDFYRDNLRGEFLDYPFWLRAVAEHPSKVYPGRKWLFWQYSGSGLSHGVDGRIDLNAFHGSEDAWHRWVATTSG